MIQIQKQWFAPVPWETIVSVNHALCQAKKNLHESNPRSYEATHALWDNAMSKTMTLQAALDNCRRCLEMAPFLFYNANTFTAIGRTLLEEGLKTLPPVEAQVIRTTVSHYIAGMIGARELGSVLLHFEKLWLAAPAALPAQDSSPASVGVSREATLPRPVA